MNIKEYINGQVVSRYNRTKGDPRFPFSIGVMIVPLSLFALLSLAKAIERLPEMDMGNWGVGVVTAILVLVLAVMGWKLSGHDKDEYRVSYDVTCRELERLLEMYGENRPRDEIISEIYGGNVYGYMWYNYIVECSSVYNTSMKNRQEVKGALAST